MKTTVDELASSMGAVIPTANAQNVSLEQLSAGYAILTKNGIATSEAGTYMKAMFGELGKSGSQTDKILKDKLGKSFAELSEEGMNTGEILNVLKEEADNSGMSLSDLFGSSEAGAAALTLIKDGGDDFNTTLASMDEVAGATTEAFDKMEDAAGVKLEKALNSLKNTAASFGDMVLPMIATLAEYLANVAGRINDLGPSAKKFIGITALIAAAIGPVLLALGSVAMALAPVAAQITRMGGLAKVLAAGMKYLRVVFLAFAGPVGITVAVLAGLALLFVTLWKRSDRFREAIQTAGDKIKEFGGKVKTAFDAVKALFEGNSVKAGALLKSLGLSDEQVMKVFVVFVQLRTKAKEALDKITEFFQQTMAKIKGFWDSEGQQILSAAQNIFDGLKKGAEVLGSVLGSVFRGIFKVIQFIMPAVLGIIKMVWGNIMGVITGALDVILGAVKIFSGLFTGDFKKMWEGIKQVFFGAIRLVWNAIQLTFFGRIAKGAAIFIGGFRAVFANMWKYLIGLFTRSVTSVYSTVARYFNLIFTTTTRIFTSVRSFILKILTDVLHTALRITSRIYTGVRNTFQSLFTSVRNIFNNIWYTIRDVFTLARDFLARTATNIFTSTRNTFVSLRTRMSEIFRGIYNNIKDRFTDIVNAAKNLPKRIGDGIGSMATKVKDGVTKVINELAKTLGKGVNGVIGGINWVLGKIGVKESNNIPKWDVPQYAQGTKGNGAHPGGFAVVNDGKGSNGGPEMIEEPGKEPYMLQGKNLLVNLAKGAKVWSGKATKDILDMVPHYALGDKLRSAGDWVKEKYNDGKEAVKAVGGKVKDVALNVFDYMKDPGGLLDLALKTLGIDKPAGGSMIGDMARGGFNKIKDSALGFIKDKLTSFGASQSGIALTGGNGGGFGAPFRFTSGPGPRNTGIPGASTMHKGWDWAAPIGTPIPSVTDGVGHRTGFHPLSGNFVEVRDPNGTIHRYQHNSRNIVKVGQQVKKGQTIALVGNTGVGSGAHLHYEKRQGYADGGIVDQAQLAWIAEGGWAESIISHDPAKRVSQKAIWEQTGKELGFDTNNPAVLEALDRIRIAVEEGHVIEMSDKVVGRTVAPYVTKEQKRTKGVQAIWET